MPFAIGLAVERFFDVLLFCSTVGSTIGSTIGSIVDSTVDSTVDSSIGSTFDLCVVLLSDSDLFSDSEFCVASDIGSTLNDVYTTLDSISSLICLSYRLLFIRLFSLLLNFNFGFI